MRGGGDEEQGSNLVARGNQSPISNLLKSWLGMGLVAFVTLWAVYGFDISPLPNFALPLPASFYPYSLWDTFVGIEQQPKTSFLLGEISARGWWYYFPYAMLFKTPTATLISVPFAIAGWLLLPGRQGQLTGAARSESSQVIAGWMREDWWTVICLLLPPALYAASAINTVVNLGLRHILPVYPFLFIAIAVVSMWRGQGPLKAAARAPAATPSAPQQPTRKSKPQRKARAS